MQFVHGCFYLCVNANNHAFYQHSGTPLARNISTVWEIKSDDVFGWLSLLTREYWTQSTILTLLGAEKDRGKLALHYSCLKGQSAAEDTSRPLMRFAAFNSLTAEHCGRNYAGDILKVHYLTENICILNELSLRFVSSWQQAIIWNNDPAANAYIHSLASLGPAQNCWHFEFSRKIIFLFWLKFYRNLFHWVQLTISQHWFRWWLVVEQGPLLLIWFDINPSMDKTLHSR